MPCEEKSDSNSEMQFRFAGLLKSSGANCSKIWRNVFALVIDLDAWKSFESMSFRVSVAKFLSSFRFSSICEKRSSKPRPSTISIL